MAAETDRWSRTWVFNGLRPSRGFLREAAVFEWRHSPELHPVLVAGLLLPSADGYRRVMNLPRSLDGVVGRLGAGFFFQGCTLSCDGCSGHYYQQIMEGDCNGNGCQYAIDGPGGDDYGAGSNQCWLTGGLGSGCVCNNCEEDMICRNGE